MTRASISDTADAAQDDAAFSRSAGLLSQGGKADTPLKTMVSDVVFDDFRRLARELDMSASELLRVLVHARLYGVERVARMTADQLQRAALSGPELAQQGHPPTSKGGPEQSAVLPEGAAR